MRTTFLLFILCTSSLSVLAQRDPYKWPFSKTSIWNMPIHHNAVYVNAGLPKVPNNDEWSPMPMMDPELIVLRPSSPVLNINYSDAGWTGKNRCAATGGQLRQVNAPSNYVIPHSGKNNCAVFLKSDGRTIVQTQPFTRCNAGGDATSIVAFTDVDIYGEGITGAHGGSGLSAIGGSLRLGELRPGQQGPRHALKVNVYAKQALYKATSFSQAYRWPATTADSYAVGHYGTNGNNNNYAMRMGALLAIHKNTDINKLGLETEPAKQLAWTLQNFGTYIVDDTYGPGFDFSAEDGIDGSFSAQFRNDWGFEFEQRVRDNTPWTRDIQRLVEALYVIDNNDANNIGGGPTSDTLNRRAPMACDFGTPGSGVMTCPTSIVINSSFCNSFQAPIIDGFAESNWATINSDTLKKNIIGTVSSSADLSANYKATWDNTGLYLLIDIKDDVLINDSGNPWDDDAVEVFIDGNNDKASSYDANDHQYLFRVNDTTVYDYKNAVAQPANPPGVSFSQGVSTGGYLMEIKISWSAIGINPPSSGELMGLDVHVNDDDNGGGRDKKITWFATQDQSSTNSSTFGTIKLENTPCNVTTGPDSEWQQENSLTIYPNPFTSTFILKISSGTIFKDAVMKIYDVCGKEVRSVSIGNNETSIDRNGLPDGIYFYKLITDNKISSFGKLVVQ